MIIISPAETIAVVVEATVTLEYAAVEVTVTSGVTMSVKVTMAIEAIMSQVKLIKQLDRALELAVSAQLLRMKQWCGSER